MKFNIEEQHGGIDIEVNETEDKKDKLLKAFQECQQGRCTCPTQEYDKLESLEIETRDDSVHLRLKAKPGQVFDTSEIDKCLRYTEDRVTEK